MIISSASDVPLVLRVLDEQAVLPPLRVRIAVRFTPVAGLGGSRLCAGDDQPARSERSVSR